MDRRSLLKTLVGAIVAAPVAHATAAPMLRCVADASLDSVADEIPAHICEVVLGNPVNPASAIRELLFRAGWREEDLDLPSFDMEAFTNQLQRAFAPICRAQV
jgi:hypothetical protein